MTSSRRHFKTTDTVSTGINHCGNDEMVMSSTKNYTIQAKLEASIARYESSLVDLELLSDVKEESVPESISTTPIATTTTTTTTTTPEPTIVNEIQCEAGAHYDANGRPYEDPVPREFLPPSPVFHNGESWQDDVITEEEFNMIELSMNLPALPEENYKALAAPFVPKSMVEMSKGYIIYMASKKKVNDMGKARLEQENQSITARAFIERFGVLAEDRDKKLTNWKTVFYVRHLLKMIPTQEAYTIDDDLFSGSQGMSEYDLDNWHATREHAIRMAVISNLSGDYVEAVFTLDLLMRFRRSQVRATHSVTFHKIEDKAPLNESLCFVCFLNDEGDFRASWVSIGLNKNIAKAMERQKPYYDGPYCATCVAHHKSLMYCTKCYCTQYCNLACLKKDKRNHEKFCKRNEHKKSYM